MLYSGENGNKTSFRGKTWKLSNGYTRACNYKGQQCNFKTQNEAIRFANKDKPLKEDTSAILKRNMTSRSGTGLDRKVFPALKRLQSGENMSLREKQWVVKQLQDNVPHTALIKVWKEVRKSSMRDGSRDGARAIEGIIDAALDGQKAGLGQAHHGPSRFGDGVNEGRQKKVNEVFSLEDLEALSTPGLRRLLASWQKRQKLSPHNQPIADNIEAIENAIQFKRSIGETNRINEAPLGTRVIHVAHLSRRELQKLVAILTKQGHYAKPRGQHLETDADDQVVHNAHSTAIGTTGGRGAFTGVKEADLGSMVNKTANPMRCSKCGSTKARTWAPSGKTLCKTCHGLQKEAMGSNKPVTVYAKDRKTVLGTVSKQSSSVGASKVAGGSVGQERVNGYLSWVRKS